MKKLTRMSIPTALFTATMITFTLSGCASTSESDGKQTVKEESNRDCKVTTSRRRRKC